MEPSCLAGHLGTGQFFKGPSFLPVLACFLHVVLGSICREVDAFRLLKNFWEDSVTPNTVSLLILINSQKSTSTTVPGCV